ALGRRGLGGLVPAAPRLALVRARPRLDDDLPQRPSAAALERARAPELSDRPGSPRTGDERACASRAACLLGRLRDLRDHRSLEWGPRSRARLPGPGDERAQPRAVLRRADAAVVG